MFGSVSQNDDDRSVAEASPSVSHDGEVDTRDSIVIPLHPHSLVRNVHDTVVPTENPTVRPA